MSAARFECLLRHAKRATSAATSLSRGALGVDQLLLLSHVRLQDDDRRDDGGPLKVQALHADDTGSGDGRAAEDARRRDQERARTGVPV